MNKYVKTCVVTDLDDTVWDWLEMWYNSFYPYFEEIKHTFNIPDEELKEDFKKLHQKYGTTEVSFAYNELTSLTNEAKKQINKKPTPLSKSIYHKYNSNKKNNLKMYLGVLDTLKKLKSEGVLVIGFTESNAFFTKYRLKHLGLDGLFDCIYTPLDTGVPNSTFQFNDQNYWEPEQTEIRYLSREIKKPNSEILGIILRDFMVKPENAIYIGDKIDRDIRMANDAGITSVYAKYGSVIDGEKYDLLKTVTHWSEEDVIREQEYKIQHENDIIRADYTLEKSYSEIFDFFQFSNYYKLDKDMIQNILSIWSQTVTVQQHFNDIALKIRNLTLTAFTFIIAALGYVIKENIVFHIWNHHIKALTIFTILGALIIAMFFFMDKFWYHRFLRGAVSQAMYIEKKWKKIIPEIQLSTAIGNASNFKLFGISMQSSKRFTFFYVPLIIIFLIMFFASFFIDYKQDSTPASKEEHLEYINKLVIENNDLKENNSILKLKNDSLGKIILLKKTEAGKIKD